MALTILTVSLAKRAWSFCLHLTKSNQVAIAISELWCLRHSQILGDGYGDNK